MSNRIDLLLQKALQALEPDERDELLHGLLLGRLTAAGSLSVGAAGPGGAPRAEDVSHERLTALLGVRAAWATGAGMKVLPIRLPEADLDRLRRFSQDSGFSMAVVIRTLVERFLDKNAHQAELVE